VDIKVVKKDEVNLQMIIKGVDVLFVNSLRRIILAEVPCMAIDEVVIIENSSMFHDEILAHRLGLIPIKTDLDSYNLPEECSCRSEFGCNLCRVSLTLDVEATNATKTVYSGDFKLENPAIAPVSSNIPIAKLAPEQKIKLEAYAKLGKGKDHAKWQPVSLCTHRYLAKIKVNEEKCDGCGECVSACPKRILLAKGKKIEVHNILDCTLCGDCVDACPKESPAISLSWDKNAFILTLESTGTLPPERIVLEALKIMEKKTEEFLDQLAIVEKEKHENA